MKNRNYLIILILILVMLLIGCEKKENKTTVKSFEQIYKEKGIPIGVKKIIPHKFEIYVNYNAKLTGYKQSFANAMIGGRIEKINVKVGDFVKKDSVIIQFPKDLPSVQYSQAKAAYELAKKTYERMKDIYQSGGISKQQLDQVHTNYEVSKANWNAVQQLINVRAPITGYVTAINVHETDNVQQRTILAIISKTEKLKSRIWVTEDEISNIKVGMKAIAEWNGIKLSGKVTETDLAMDPKHSAFGVNLIFDNQLNKVKSGVIAEIKILIYDNKNAVTVPLEIIKTDNKGNYLYVVHKDKAIKRYVTLGKGENEVEVKSGLMEGELIITKGSELVYDGAKIKIVEQ